MKIKDKLNLNIGISFITAIILFAVILISSNIVTEENRAHVLFREIYKAVAELDSVKYEYCYQYITLTVINLTLSLSIPKFNYKGDIL